jgi:hypothetical protein
VYKCAREVMLSSPLPCQVRAEHAECTPGSLSYWNQVLPTMVRSGCRPTSDQELSEKARPAVSSGTVRYIGSSGSQATTTNTSTHTDGLGEVEPLGKVLDLACVLGILLRLPIPLIGKPLAGGEWASRQLDRVDRGLCSTRHHDVEQPVCYGEACG